VLLVPFPDILIQHIPPCRLQTQRSLSAGYTIPGSARVYGGFF
jgi:hypothetical protein